MHPDHMLNRKRCPFMSMHLECYAGGFATIDCLKHEFHSECEHKHRAMNKPKLAEAAGEHLNT